MKNLLLLLFFVLPTALFSASPSCVAGMEVSIVDANGKVIKKGKFNNQGQLNLDGVKDVVWDVQISNNGKSIVLGVNKTKKRIDKSTPLLFEAKLSNYKNGDDLLLRKRPGKISKTTLSNNSSNETNSTGKTEANINTSRSNIKSRSLDTDDDGDSVDDDCDDVAIEVTTTEGRSGGIRIIIKAKNIN